MTAGVAPAPPQRGRAVDATLDTARVLWLLVILVLVAAPHAFRIPPWISLVVGGILGLRALFAWRGLGMPPAWSLAILAAAAAAGIWLSYGRLHGRDSGVALLLLMLCLKTLELRSRRDAHVLVVLGYFLLVTGFLYSQSMSTALYLLGCVWALTGCLMAFQRNSGPHDPAALMRSAGLMLAQAAPLMLILFLAFPRIQGPLWGLPLAQNAGITGLSDSMSPGSLSNLSLSDEVAFRVDFPSQPIPPRNRLYWRGPVMWDFDGRTWRAGESAPISGTVLRDVSEPVRYAVTLEAHDSRWLFALDIPAERLDGSLLTADLQLLSLRPVRSRMRYELSSWLSYRVGHQESMRNLQRALALPPDFNPRTRDLAKRLREQSATPRDLAARALSLFRDQPFFYTLAPPELGRDSIDEFLFEARRGFCEHFASSFVFLMRAAGVPARIVTGYQGGEVNPMGNYLIVRQADAHAWVEVWMRGEGWVRMDPTAAVSPQRIQAGFSAALPAGERLPLMRRTDSALLRNVRFALDAAANGWNQWVLGYSAQRQREVFERLGMSRATWQRLAAVLAGGTGLAVIALLLITLRRLRGDAPDSVMRAWAAFSARLAPLGLGRRPGEGPLDHGERVAAALPAEAGKARAIAALVAELRYGAQPAPDALARLKRQVRSFRPRPA